MSTLAAIVFWACVLALLYTHLGYPLVLRLLLVMRSNRDFRRDRLRERQLAAASAPPAWESPDGPRVSLIVPAYDEEDVIAAKVADALALDYPRELPAGDRRLRRLDRRDRRARPRGRRRPRPRAPPGRQDRGAERRRRGGRRRGPRLLRRQQRVGARRPAPARRPVRGPEDRLRLRPGSLHQRRGRQPRGRLLALRDGGAPRWSPTSPASPPATARSTPCAPRPTKRWRSPAATTSASRSASPAATCAPSTQAEARRHEKMVPTIEGEFARKRRMMIGLWDIVVGEGMLVLPPTAALPSSWPRTGCSATRAPSSTSSPSSPTACCSATAGSSSSPSSPSWDRRRAALLRLPAADRLVRSAATTC